MKFEIKPYASVGDLKFGASFYDVRRQLGMPDLSFKRNQFSSWPLDQFENHSLFVIYDKSGKVEAFEFYIEAKVFLENQKLSSLSFEEALELDSFCVHDQSVRSEKFGIDLFYPKFKKHPETILVYSKGYWN